MLQEVREEVRVKRGSLEQTRIEPHPLTFQGRCWSTCFLSLHVLTCSTAYGHQGGGETSGFAGTLMLRWKEGSQGSPHHYTFEQGEEELTQLSALCVGRGLNP